MSKQQEIDWPRYRALWEADPKLTQAALSRMIGVSRVAVSKRAKAEKWKKLAEQHGLQKVVRQRAHDRADERTTDLAGEDKPTEEPLGEHPDAALPALTAEIAVEARAKIIERHRREWAGARNNVYKAIQNNDFEKAKLGKITAEALQIIQNGERKAWGLDKEEETVKIVYSNEEGGW